MLPASGIRVPTFHEIGPIESGWWCVTGRLSGARLCDLPMEPQAQAAVAVLEDAADHRTRLRFYVLATGLACAAFFAHDGRDDDIHLLVRRLAPLLEAPPSLTEIGGYWLHTCRP